MIDLLLAYGGWILSALACIAAHYWTDARARARKRARSQDE